MIKTVIFDLDGTLYRKRGLKARIIWSEICSGHLYTLYRERVARIRMRGKDFGSEEAFYRAFFRMISPLHPDRAERWYHEHYMPLQVSLLTRYFHVNDWVVPRLQQLRQDGVKTVVFSDYSYAKEKICAIGLDPSLFDWIVDAPSLGGLKPSPASSHRILDRLGSTPDQALFVGDREECDVAAARLIGAHSELVSHGKLVHDEWQIVK